MKKIKSQKGFTLVEMLACVVTLILLAGICTTGTNLAMNSYNRSLFESNSQMLESTLSLYLGDILRHSQPKVETDPVTGVKTIKITNSIYGMYDGWIDLYAGASDSGVDPTGRIYIHKVDDVGVKLLSEKVYTNTLKISDFAKKLPSSSRSSA